MKPRFFGLLTIIPKISWSDNHIFLHPNWEAREIS